MEVAAEVAAAVAVGGCVVGGGGGRVGGIRTLVGLAANSLCAP